MLIQNSKEQPEAQGEQTKPKVRIHKKHHPEKRKSFVVEDLKALRMCFFLCPMSSALNPTGEKHHLQIPWIQLRLSVSMTLRRSVASASQRQGQI